MNKKGFTLIEIIVCISLISIIGVGTTIAIVNKKNETKTVYESNSNNFENALAVYLSNNKEVVENINSYVDGAVISLEVLKNEGLIDSNIKGINYKEDYFLLSNAVFDSSSVEEDCKNQISIQTIKSWDLSKYDSNKVIYICPKESNSTTNNYYNDYRQFLTTGDDVYVAKGKNPNNWVQVDYDISAVNVKMMLNIDGDKTQNLWRLVSINSGEMRLILGSNICSDCSSGSELSYDEIFNTVIDPNNNDEVSKKRWIYDSIKLKDNIKKANYLSNYNATSGSYNMRRAVIQEFNPNQFYIGIISKKEIEDSIINGETYLNDGKSYMLGKYRYGLDMDRFGKIIYNGEENGRFDTKDLGRVSDSEIDPTIYRPVITFDNNIKLIANETSTCKSGATLGSVECPYRLSVD